MKLVKSILELEVYGEKVELRKPTFKEAQSYRDELIKLGESGDATEVMVNFLEKLGLKKEIFDSLELAHVNQIMDLVTGSKKN